MYCSNREKGSCSLVENADATSNAYAAHALVKIYFMELRLVSL